MNLDVSVKRPTRIGAELTDLRDMLAKEMEERGPQDPSSRWPMVRILLASWAINDCSTKRGARYTSRAEEAITELFATAGRFCDAASLVGPGDAQT